MDSSQSFRHSVLFGFVDQRVVGLLDRLELLVRRLDVLILAVLVRDDLRDDDVLVIVLATAAARVGVLLILIVDADEQRVFLIL